MSDRRETQNFPLAQVHSDEQRRRESSEDEAQSQPAEVTGSETLSSNASSPEMGAEPSVAGNSTSNHRTSHDSTSADSTSRARSDSDTFNSTRLRDIELATWEANFDQLLLRVSQPELDNRNRESQDVGLLAEIDAFNGKLALLIRERDSPAQNWQSDFNNTIEDPATGQTILFPDNDMVTTSAMIDEDASTIPITDDIDIDISFESSSSSDSSQSSIYSQEDTMEDPARGGETMQFPRSIKCKTPTRSAPGTLSTDDNIVFADSEESSTEADENNTGGRR